MVKTRSTPVVASKARARELLDAVARVHALDQQRIKSGEIKASDLFLISSDRAMNAKITWNFGRRRSA